jgi:hypothetical protein
MSFTLKDLADKLLGGFGIGGLVDKVLARLAELRTEYPDIAKQIDELEAFLVNEVRPYLDVTQMTATLRGIATDLATGQTGVDKDAWSGSV